MDKDPYIETAKHLAVYFGEAAEEIYETEGSVEPVLLLLDDQGLGLLMHPSRMMRTHPGEASALIIAVVGKMLPVRFIGFIVESFMTSMPKDDPRANTIERGQLTEWAETDPDVRTAICTTVWDVKSRDDSYCRLATVKGDPRQCEWDINEIEGPSEGYIDDLFTRAFAEAPLLEHRPPEEVALALMKTGLVTGAMLMEPRDD